MNKNELPINMNAQEDNIRTNWEANTATTKRIRRGQLADRPDGTGRGKEDIQGDEESSLLEMENLGKSRIIRVIDARREKGLIISFPNGQRGNFPAHNVTGSEEETMRRSKKSGEAFWRKTPCHLYNRAAIRFSLPVIFEYGLRLIFRSRFNVLHSKTDRAGCAQRRRGTIEEGNGSDGKGRECLSKVRTKKRPGL